MYGIHPALLCHKKSAGFLCDVSCHSHHCKTQIYKTGVVLTIVTAITLTFSKQVLPKGLPRSCSYDNCFDCCRNFIVFPQKGLEKLSNAAKIIKAHPKGKEMIMHFLKDIMFEACL